MMDPTIEVRDIGDLKPKLKEVADKIQASDGSVVIIFTDASDGGVDTEVHSITKNPAYFGYAAGAIIGAIMCSKDPQVRIMAMAGYKEALEDAGVIRQVSPLEMMQTQGNG